MTTGVEGNFFQTSFAYSAQRDRVYKSQETQETWTLGNIYERILDPADPDISEEHRYYVYAEGERVAEVSFARRDAADDLARSTRYFHLDHRGSTIAVSDETGAITDEFDYTAFGQPLSELTVSFGFTGHRQEQDLGLIDAGGRFYDPVLGVFLSPDALSELSGGSPRMNRYAYTGYDPMNYTDPTGNFIVTAAIVGAIVGAAIGAGTYYAAAGDDATALGFVLSAVGGAGLGFVSGGYGAALVGGGGAAAGATSISVGTSTATAGYSATAAAAVGLEGSAFATAGVVAGSGVGSGIIAGGLTGRSNGAVRQAERDLGGGVGDRAQVQPPLPSKAPDSRRAGPTRSNGLGTIPCGERCGQYSALDFMMSPGVIVGKGVTFAGRALAWVLGKIGPRVAARGALALSTAQKGALLQAGLQPFKNSGLTVAGRALTKHPELVGLTKATLNKTLRSPGAINAAAEGALGGILHSGTAVRATSGRLGQVLNVTGTSGFGARFSEAGKFIGFLNP